MEPAGFPADENGSSHLLLPHSSKYRSKSRCIPRVDGLDGSVTVRKMTFMQKTRNKSCMTDQRDLGSCTIRQTTTNRGW